MVTDSVPPIILKSARTEATPPQPYPDTRASSSEVESGIEHGAEPRNERSVDRVTVVIYSILLYVFVWLYNLYTYITLCHAVCESV